MLDRSVIATNMWAERPPMVREHSDRAQFEQWVDSWLGRVGDVAWAQKGLAALAKPGTTCADYQERIIDVNGCKLVAGIRFLGGKNGEPFVDINVASAPIDQVPWRTAARLASDAYRVFEPRKLRRVRWLTRDEVFAAPGWTLDQLLIAGPLSALDSDVQLAPPLTLHLVRSERVEGATRAVLAMYNTWYAVEPWMRGFVPPQTATSLQDSVEHGVALTLEYDGRTIGLVSCKPEAEFRTGCTGLCVHEKVISPDFAGRGLSRALHGALVKHAINKFPSSTLLYGTIDARNLRSLVNARKAGRRAVAALEFMPFGPW